MKSIFVHFIFISFVVLFGWCDVSAEMTNCVVAFVNEDVVTLYELNSSIRDMTGNDPERLKAQDRSRFEEIRRRVLDLLVEEKITISKVKELGINVSEEEVDAAVDRVKHSNGWNDEELFYNLRREGSSVEDLREDLRRSIQRNRLVNYEVKSRIVIREEDLRDYYESNKESFSSGGKVHLAGIVLMFTNPTDSGERAATISKAEEIHDQLREGKSFEELAAKFSKGPGAGEGGDLGVFPWSELDEQILDQIEPLAPGEVTEPIIRPEGVQILKVLDRSEGEAKSFEDVKDAIYDIFYEKEMDARYRKWIADLKDEAYIKIVL
jgi:peptidyl-prolyl cis-trans isomerase SurA